MKSKILSAFFVLLFLFLATYYAFPKIFLGPMVHMIRTASGLTEKTVQVEDHQIHYLEGGTGEAVVLLHGIFAEKDHWVDFARRFGKGYRLIIPDLAAFGESTRLPNGSYDYHTQVQRLSDFLTKLNVKSMHLAGNSMGGTIAALYSIRFPEQIQSLAFIGAPHGIRTPLASDLDRQLDSNQPSPLVPRTPEEFEAMLDMLFVRRPFLPRPIYLEARDKAIREAEGNAKIFARQVQDRYLLQSEISKLTHRTFALWGGSEKMFHPSGAEILKTTIQNSEVIVMPDVGHLPHMEVPQKSSGLYRAFVEKK